MDVFIAPVRNGFKSPSKFHRRANCKLNMPPAPPQAPAPENLGEEPVAKTFRWLLILGRLVAVIPHSNVFSRKRELEVRWRSVPVVHSLLVTTFILAFLSAKVWGCFVDVDVGVYDNIISTLRRVGVEGPSYSLSVAFVYYYFYKNGGKLGRLLGKWTDTMSKLGLASKDKSLPTFFLLVSLAVLSFGVVENLFYDITRMRNKGMDDKEFLGKPFLQKMFRIGGEELSDYLPYNPLLTIYIVFCSKTGTYAWNFGDIFLITCCRAISHKFAELNCQIEKLLSAHCEDEAIVNRDTCVREMNAEQMLQPSQVRVLQNGGEKEGYCIRKEAIWAEIRTKVFLLCELADEVSGFVAPLVTSCYLCNIWLMILQGVRFLNGMRSTDDSASVYLSSFQFTLRVILVTFHASQVYHSTEDVVKTLEHVPDHKFAHASARLERYLERHPIGVTLFGTMKITRSLFISIISFLFTTEIILFQTVSSSNHSNLQITNHNAN